MKRQVYTDNFRRGLQTSGRADGLPFPSWAVMEDVRVSEGPIRRRAGRVHLATNGDEGNSATRLNGTSGAIEFPWHDVYALGRTFTLELLVEMADVTGTQYLWGWKHATDYPWLIYMDGGTVTVKVQDSGATVTTLTSASTYSASDVLEIQVVRNGSSLVLNVNGAQEDADTMSGTLPLLNAGVPMDFGANGGTLADFAAGDFSHARVLNVALGTTDHVRRRWLDPRSEIVVGCWNFAPGESGWYEDESKYENHGEEVGTPGTTGSNALDSMPVQMIRQFRTHENKRRLAVAAGGRLYEVVI